MALCPRMRCIRAYPTAKPSTASNSCLSMSDPSTTAPLPVLYPDTRAERDTWILARRPERDSLDPLRPYAFFVEEEYSAEGEVVSVATVFLTNRECPWRCLMCDLWKNTLLQAVPVG